jgi:hypothetical protein
MGHNMALVPGTHLAATNQESGGCGGKILTYFLI